MKIYDELTNEELTAPDLSAGYLYTARRVAEHVPEKWRDAVRARLEGV